MFIYFTSVYISYVIYLYISNNPHKKLYRGGDWGRERQSDILKVTQVGMGKAGIWVQAVCKVPAESLAQAAP